MREMNELTEENFTLDLKMNSTAIEAFLELIRCGTRGKQPQIKYFTQLTQQDWFLIFNMIKMQSVVGVCLQPALDLPIELRPPRQLLLQWGAYRNYIKAQNERYKDVWTKLQAIFAEGEVYPVILKGLAVSACYIHPEYREAGDIDLYFPEKYEEGLEQLIKHGIEIHYDTVHKEHDKIEVDGIEIELHKNFANVPFEIILPHETRHLQLGDTDILTSDINSTALLLLLHPVKHLFSSGVGIRHLCDWALFLEKYKDQINTDSVINETKRLGLYTFVRCFTTLACQHLGLELEKDSPWTLNTRQHIADFMFKDIIIRGDFGKLADAMRKKWFPYYIQSTKRVFRYYLCWPEFFWKRIPRKMIRRFVGILVGRPYGVHTPKYKK